MGFSMSDTILGPWFSLSYPLGIRWNTTFKDIKFNLETQAINMLTLCASKANDNSYISLCDKHHIPALFFRTHCTLLPLCVPTSDFFYTPKYSKLSILLFKSNF